MPFDSWLNKIVALSLGLGLLNPGVSRAALAQSRADSVVAPVGAAGSSEALTLSEALEIALAKNPLTRVASAGRQIANAQLKAARAGRLPLLQASESVTTSNNPVFVFGSLLEQGRFGANNFQIEQLNNPAALTNFRAGLTARFPVFDQRQTSARIDVARLDQQQADQQTDLVAQHIRFEVLRSYYGVLLAQSRVVVADEAIQSAAADLTRVRDRFEAGLVVGCRFAGCGSSVVGIPPAADSSPG